MLMRCPMYKSTYDGPRCILMPPEEWRMSKNALERYCNNGGSGCPVYSKYISARSPRGQIGG